MDGKKGECLLTSSPTNETRKQADSVEDPDMAAQLTATTSAATKNQSAKQKDAEAQSLRQDRDTLLGLAEGQTADTPGTALNAVSLIRDELELKFRGKEETLGLWGLKVQVGSAKRPIKKPKTP